MGPVLWIPEVYSAHIFRILESSIKLYHSYFIPRLTTIAVLISTPVKYVKYENVNYGQKYWKIKEKISMIKRVSVHICQWQWRQKRQVVLLSFILNCYDSDILPASDRETTSTSFWLDASFKGFRLTFLALVHSSSFTTDASVTHSWLSSDDSLSSSRSLSSLSVSVLVKVNSEMEIRSVTPYHRTTFCFHFSFNNSEKLL